VIFWHYEVKDELFNAHMHTNLIVVEWRICAPSANGNEWQIKMMMMMTNETIKKQESSSS